MTLAFQPNYQEESVAHATAWYALKVRTRSESVAALALQNRGYVSYSPVYQERRRYSDRMKAVETAAFPGYIFCRFNTNLKIPVLSSPAVEYIVGRAGNHVPIEESEIDAIRRFIAAGGRAVPYLLTGQRVRIEFGPMAGIEGFFVRSGGAGRVTLSVDLLQRSIAVQIDHDYIRPL
jgi:transcription antitermination factor NusG